MHCVWVGANPGFDESRLVEAQIQSRPALRRRFRFLPACDPPKVWEYLCAADIFAFPSHREGISNSLLEAMAMEIPAVCFAIPSNCEIDSGEGALLMVPPLNVRLFSEQLVQISRSADKRLRHGKLGAALVKDRFQVETNMKRALKTFIDTAFERG
jgi:glycosyltransferase involved in cell wall biosynthesis